MKHISYSTLIALYASLMLSAATAPGPKFFETLVAESDAILVGNISEAGQAAGVYSVNVNVVTSFKGSLLAGANLVATYTATGKGSTVTLKRTVRGLLFLKRNTSGAWSIEGSRCLGIGLAEAYWPVVAAVVPNNVRSIVGPSLTEQLVGFLADLMEVDQTNSGLTTCFVSKVPPALAKPVYLRWELSSDPKLRLLAFAGLISLGDVNALTRATAEIAVQSGEADALSRSFRLWPVDDVTAIRAIGAFTTASGARPAVVSNGAAALSALHREATLPYLYRLLDSVDPAVRQLAVAGFSGFVTNMRITPDGSDRSEALDEVLNPGRRAKLPRPHAPFEMEETRRHLHFGPFRDVSDADSYTSFWRSWYEKNRPLIGGVAP